MKVAATLVVETGFGAVEGGIEVGVVNGIITFLPFCDNKWRCC